MRTISFDLEALRCFVLGIELGSFALAAQRLHRSTSAASAQLKKLEQQCGVALVEKVGRHLQPTEAGEVLLGYARRLLALNDEAAQAVTGADLPGALRFGMQEDFSEVLLPQVLAQFARAHPQVQLTSVVARNSDLVASIRQDQLDLALSWAGPDQPPYSEPVAELSMQWIGPADAGFADTLLQQTPLPLVMFDGPCLMRQLATQALDRAGIPWRLAFSSRSLGSLWRACEAGLGVTVRTEFGMPATLKALRTTLPALPGIGIRIDRNNAEMDPVQMRLHWIIKEQVALYLKHPLGGGY